MDGRDEPSVDSKDREERIRARRSRIHEKLAAKESGEAGATVNVQKKKEIDKKEVLKGKSQIQDSRRKLRQLLETGDEDVTRVRVEGDDRENQRRMNEEARRLDRRQKLLFEAESSARRNAAIAMKWASLFEKEIPLDLLNDMEAQREACLKVISQKDELIKEFQLVLKSKDEEYVKSLKRWAEDIDTLLGAMTEQFRGQQRQYELETEEIESVFRQERKELIDTNRVEMEMLMEKRRQMEQSHMEDRQKRIELNQEQLQRNRLKDSEEYTNLKIKLETEIQKLEQQLEVMRATYQLNTEKLEYNFRVLSERDVENSNTINQQKRKLARLQDNLSSLMAKYGKTDKQFRTENMELTDEYKRITEQFQDLQGKYRHFQLSDARKYDEVWSMKEEEVKRLLGTVLQADKIIHEQQLGLYWYPPNEEAVNAAFHEARMRARAVGKKKAAEQHAQTDTLEALVSDVNPEVRRMFLLLCDEAGFLVESKVRKMVDSAQGSDGEGIKIDSILKALGVTGDKDIERLQRFFFNDDDQGEPELISPDQACLAIKQFLKELMAQHTTVATAFHTTAAADDDAERPSHEARDIWDLCTTVIAPKTFRVWGALEAFMIRYNHTLTQRAEAIVEIDTLQSQNNELKMLLNQYLGSRINQELYVPPTATISRLTTN
mmetsp:Transcript_15177/g.29993  ORF Transcript_15177/g.29993 Transcript_15177/m.29993 type:complete len:663 (-) Transcript_15177:23-2011(-)